MQMSDYAYCGLIEVVPNNNVSIKQSGASTGKYEMTTRNNNYDKQAEWQLHA